jgi:hypothetical protein
MMKRFFCIALFAVSLSPLLGAAPVLRPASEAWEQLLDEKFRDRPPFAYVENDPDQPNVLLYGDSISIGYTSEVRKNLEGTANVYRLHRNGGDSGSFVIKMKAMHGTMRDPGLDDPWAFEWDVIHFNVGLHDLKYIRNGKLDKEAGTQVNSIEAYQRNLRDIIAYLRKLAPGASLIFATTTPVPEGEPGRHAGDARRYNEAALEVMGEYPDIVINDLYAFIKPNHPNWWAKPGNVHYNQAGNTAMGQEVAQVILEVLP